MSSIKEIQKEIRKAVRKKGRYTILLTQKDVDDRRLFDHVEAMFACVASFNDKDRQCQFLTYTGTVAAPYTTCVISNKNIHSQYFKPTPGIYTIYKTPKIERKFLLPRQDKKS